LVPKGDHEVAAKPNHENFTEQHWDFIYKIFHINKKKTIKICFSKFSLPTFKYFKIVHNIQLNRNLFYNQKIKKK